MSPAVSTDQIRNWFRVIAKIPFLAVIVLALIMQATKEFYPFSHYPMYSDLPPSVEYYYLTTVKGEPLPQVRYLDFPPVGRRKCSIAALRKSRADATSTTPPLQKSRKPDNRHFSI